MAPRGVSKQSILQPLQLQDESASRRHLYPVTKKQT